MTQGLLDRWTGAAESAPRRPTMPRRIDALRSAIRPSRRASAHRCRQSVPASQLARALMLTYALRRSTEWPRLHGSLDDPTAAARRQPRPRDPGPDRGRRRTARPSVAHPATTAGGQVHLAQAGDEMIKLGAGLLALGWSSRTGSAIASNTRHRVDLRRRCGHARRRREHDDLPERPPRTTSPTSWPTRARGSWSPRTQDQADKALRPARRAARPGQDHPHRRRGRRRLRHRLGRAARSWASQKLDRVPQDHRGTGRRARPRVAGDDDLHLGHDRAAEGRRAAAPLLDLRGLRASRRSGSSVPDDVHFLWLPLSHVFGKVLLAAQYQIGFRPPPTAACRRS